MLESKLNVCRHELRNRKALTEKITTDHLREMKEVHSHYRRLVQERDKTIELLNKAREQVRLDSKTQMEHAGTGKEATMTNEESFFFEDSVGQKMDALHCEIKRIADAYAKVLAQDKEMLKYVQPQPRPNESRSRFILLYLAVMFGTLVSLKPFNIRFPLCIGQTRPVVL
jgi:NAD-specific glutamate dehydrogenase